MTYTNIGAILLLLVLSFSCNQSTHEDSSNEKPIIEKYSTYLDTLSETFLNEQIKSFDTLTYINSLLDLPYTVKIEEYVLDTPYYHIVFTDTNKSSKYYDELENRIGDDDQWRNNWDFEAISEFDWTTNDTIRKKWFTHFSSIFGKWLRIENYGQDSFNCISYGEDIMGYYIHFTDSLILNHSFMDANYFGIEEIKVIDSAKFKVYTKNQLSMTPAMYDSLTIYIKEPYIAVQYSSFGYDSMPLLLTYIRKSEIRDLPLVVTECAELPFTSFNEFNWDMVEQPRSYNQLSKQDSPNH